MRGLNRSIAALLALLLILCIAVPEMADAAMLRQGLLRRAGKDAAKQAEALGVL